MRLKAKEIEMKNLKCRVAGINELRMNNPQTADSLNKYAKKIKALRAVKKKTDADEELLRNMEVESKLYFNEDVGVWIPTTWIIAAIGKLSHKQIKVAKADIRGAVFMNGTKMKLTYQDMKKVKKIEDLVLNPFFRSTELLKQGMVKIPKSIPTFNNWSFEIDLDFDEEVITELEIERVLTLAVTRHGFGDFRPTYGRGTVEDLVISDCEY